MNNRIGIIGDVHSECLRLEKAIEFFLKNRIDLVVCTGDIADGKGDINATCELLSAHSIVCVRGNHDRWLLSGQVRDIPDAHSCRDLTSESRSYLEGLAIQELIKLPQGEMLLCHGVLDRDMGKIWPGTERTSIERSEPLDDLLVREAPRIIVNGHIHYRTIIDFEDCIVINAGSLKGERAGVTVIDFETDMVSGYLIGEDLSIKEAGNVSLSDRTNRTVWKNTQSFNGRWTPVTLS